MANPAHINALRTGIVDVLRTDFSNNVPSVSLYTKGIRNTSAKLINLNTVEIALFTEGNPHPVVFTVTVAARKPKPKWD